VALNLWWTIKLSRVVHLKCRFPPKLQSQIKQVWEEPRSHHVLPALGYSGKDTVNHTLNKPGLHVREGYVRRERFVVAQ
jgi:hypothetical protein